MSKILAVADIHINDYAQRNPTNRFRLYQGSRTVAQNIIDAGKREGCDYVVFAGDIIEKSILRPYVQSEVKLFLDTIMANFKEGFLIYGNHDVDNKSSDLDINDSCLAVMLPPNLHYAHQRTIRIDDTTIGFNNWQSSIDLSWIQNKVDVLFTHATICYSKEAEKLYESQQLDETKFDIAFCGDIHRMGQIGKYVSIGIPVKGKMGDSDDSSGVVLDCSTHNWKWVNLNPNDNLMKFAYTSNLEEEGWKDDIHTWMVYKQDNSGLVGNKPNIKVDAWQEISGLVDDAIFKANLQVVHNEVLKNIHDIDANEVDFNFTPLWFHCKNWRSIDEATINFKDGDKVLIQGANGAGKSSLLSAIKYAFVDVSDTVGLTSLKPFIQFGTKDCYTEIEFLYQGNVCKIKRGTKEYGLWINGEPQKFSDKRLFEQEVRNRFPFTKYVDAFLFDSEHHRFIGGMSPERKTEIVSKFLKLDRIDTFHETAFLMADQLKKEASNWNTKIKETEKVLNYIEDKLHSIVVPSISKSELEKLKQEGLEIQRKNNEWNKFSTLTAQLQVRIQEYTDKLNGLNTESACFRSQDVIDSEINAINAQIQNLQSRLVDLGNIRVNLDYKNREYQNLRQEGNKAWTEANEIALGKKCSHCGQVIKNTESMEKHKQELLQKVEEIKPKIAQIISEIQELENLKANSEQEYQKINQDISTLNSETTKRMMEKTHQDQVKRDIETCTNLLSQTQNQLNSLGVVEKVELPEHFMEKMSELESGIAAWNLYETSENDKITKTREYEILQNEVMRINNCLSDLDAYIKLTGPTGIIYEEIMNKLKDQFSDNQVHYVVTRKGKGNKEHLSLNPQYANNGNWVDYEAASSGQKTILDIAFLSKIVNRVGLMIFDEFLKSVDSNNTDVCLDMIKEMNVGCLLLTSHLESLQAFNNRTIRLELNESGLTKIDIS